MNRANYKFAKCQRKLLGPLSSLLSECRCFQSYSKRFNALENSFHLRLRNETFLTRLLKTNHSYYMLFYFHSVVLCCVSVLFLYRL